MKTDTCKSELERRIAQLTSRRTAVSVGRAAWGLFQVLSIWRKPQITQRIAIPSFLCQSPLAAVVRAGWKPVFCDVNPVTGNVADTEWNRVIEDGVNAVLYVHLFGNVGDARSISERCQKAGILFIEDAAQAYGGELNGEAVGSHGDAAIVSFGHTKLIDVGQSGMVVTNDPSLANEIRRFSESYTGYRTDTAPVSRVYRERFYAARGLLGTLYQSARDQFKGLLRIYEPLVAVRSNPEVAEKILLKLANLDMAIQERREKAQMYLGLLQDTALIPLSTSEGSVPWRAAFRLPGIDWITQQTISDAIRREGIDVSNWYIPSHWLMDGVDESDESLANTERLSREIFQLWVDEKTTRDSMIRTAKLTTQVLREHGYA